MFKHEFFERFELPSEMVDGHRYYTTPTGTRYPSVTTVLGQYADKTWLYEWRKRVGEEKANEISRRATTRGTRLHAIFEKYLANDPSYLEGVMPTNTVLFKAMKPIVDERVGTIYGIEHPLYSHRLRTAGKTDLIADFDGIRSIIDFKTASRSKEESDINGYFLQSTCYALMTGERTEISIPQIVILICVENDEPQVFVKKTSEFVKPVVNLFKNHHLKIL